MFFTPVPPEVASSGGVVLNWFLLALITAGIAQGKNRSGFAWFLASAVLGPFAMLLLVIFFPKEKKD